MKALRWALAFTVAALPSSAENIAPVTLTVYHENPDLALVPGSQSRLDATETARILKEAGVTGTDPLMDVARIHRWIGDNFNSAPAGGQFVGKTTAQGLLKSRELTGCHDWALMLATLLRAAGMPALMADAVDMQWMTDVRAGRPLHEYDGHVFVEVYISGRWVLLNSTSPDYIPDYDPANPFIPMKAGNQESYCVMVKGIDPAGYGLGGAIKSLGDYMVNFAQSVDPAHLRRPGYHMQQLPGAWAPLPNLSDSALARSRVVVQIPERLDIHIEKVGGRYLAHLYPYGRVFQAKPIQTLSFKTMAEVKRYLRSL